MKINRTVPAIAASLALVMAGVVFAGVSATLAQDGCPSEASSNGADHANENSAHGEDKQGERDCPTPQPVGTIAPTPTSGASEATDTPTPTATFAPTPTPTSTPSPTPTPTGSADVGIISTSVISPLSAAAGSSFQVSAWVTIRNYGPTTTALVDVSFVPTMPADCSSSGPVTVEDRPVTMGTNVTISQSWSVICSQPGQHTFVFAFSVALDPSEASVNPSPANNTAFASRTTQVN